jgi:hypothetical protein
MVFFLMRVIAYEDGMSDQMVTVVDMCLFTYQAMLIEL